MEERKGNGGMDNRVCIELPGKSQHINSFQQEAV